MRRYSLSLAAKNSSGAPNRIKKSDVSMGSGEFYCLVPMLRPLVLRSTSLVTAPACPDRCVSRLSISKSGGD
jgi:hypothetical protein